MNAWTDVKSIVFVYIFIWNCLLNAQKCNVKWVEMTYHSWSTAYLQCFIVFREIFLSCYAAFFIWTHSPPYLMFFCSMILLNPFSKISCVLCLKSHSHPHILTNTLSYSTMTSLSIMKLSPAKVSNYRTYSAESSHMEGHTLRPARHKILPFSFFLLPFTSWVHSAKKECRERGTERKKTERRRREWAKIKHHLHNVAFVPIFSLFNYHI